MSIEQFMGQYRCIVQREGLLLLPISVYWREQRKCEKNGRCLATSH
jgi:hypothetical protein